MVERFVKYLLEHQIALIFFLIVFGWFLFDIRRILVLFFLGYIIMASLMPFVSILQKKRVPKVLSVAIPYVVVLIILFALIFPLFPFFNTQIQEFFKQLPNYLNKSANIFGFAIDPKQLATSLSNDANVIGRNVFQVTTQIFGGVLFLFSLIIISFYLLYYHDLLEETIVNLIGTKYRKRTFETINQIEEKLGAWLRGQIVLSVFIGGFSWIALSFLGVPYALPLALLSGIFEILPTIGPTLSAIPAVIVALTISPTLALLVILAYVIIQMSENHILVPKIMQKSVGLNPIIVIFVILIGARLMGIAGALLSIPFVSLLIVLYRQVNKAIV